MKLRGSLLLSIAMIFASIHFSQGLILPSDFKLLRLTTFTESEQNIAARLEKALKEYKGSTLANNDLFHSFIEQMRKEGRINWGYTDITGEDWNKYYTK
ncbi:uncharacterized protein UTRI_03634 [Ustilago trichophora]|uniref:Uncharacterized protein n=1 Tax=Ustilago trichophora TaxID=86804 RepID=A0A5C3E484_9BASI|nr:uncharacterized protein UTRI_03634 [Ustilago trichophora]